MILMPIFVGEPIEIKGVKYEVQKILGKRNLAGEFFFCIRERIRLLGVVVNQIKGIHLGPRGDAPCLGGGGVPLKIAGGFVDQNICSVRQFHHFITGFGITGIGSIQSAVVGKPKPVCIFW